ERAVRVETVHTPVVPAPVTRVGEVQRSVRGEGRIVRLREAVAQRAHLAAVEHAERAGAGAADRDAAAAVDREPEHEARRVSRFLERSAVDVDPVELAGLAAGPENAG